MSEQQNDEKKYQPKDVRLVVGVTVFFLISAITTLVALTKTRHYFSETRIKIVSPTSDGQSATIPKETVMAEVKVIQSDIILKPVIEKLSLKTKWAQRYFITEGISASHCLQILRARLDVWKSVSTNVIHIGVVDSVPSDAAALANAITASYSNYCTTTNSSIRVQVLGDATVPTRPIYSTIVKSIIRGIMWAIALGVGLGLASNQLLHFLRVQMQRTPPPLPKQRPFEKY